MKFTCEKSALVAAVSVASHTVAAKSSLQALEGILLQAHGSMLKLTGYNLETGITTSAPAEIREEGTCIMPARLFFDVIRKLPDDEVSVFVDEKLRVVCQSGVSRISFSATSADDYPDLPDVDDAIKMTIPRCELRQLITGTLFSASTNASRPVHTGCLFEVEDGEVTIIAVDGYRMAIRRWCNEEKKGPLLRFIAPAPALKELEKTLGDDDGPVTFCQSGKHLLFRFGGFSLVCRTITGDFLDWRRVLPTDNPIKLTAQCSKISATVERVGLVIQENARSSVRCTFGRNTVDLETNTVIGSAKDACDLAGDGQGLEIGFNCKYLTDALRAVPDEETVLELSTSLNPIVMTPCDGSNRYAYMVLPVRIKEQ